MVTLQVQEYDSEPFSDMSPSEEGNVCHDPGGRCDGGLVQGGSETLLLIQLSAGPILKYFQSFIIIIYLEIIYFAYFGAQRFIVMAQPPIY